MKRFVIAELMKADGMVYAREIMAEMVMKLNMDIADTRVVLKEMIEDGQLSKKVTDDNWLMIGLNDKSFELLGQLDK